MSIKKLKEHRQPVAHKAFRQPPSAERQRQIEEHLDRVREIGAVIDQQWTPKTVSAVGAIAEQRK